MPIDVWLNTLSEENHSGVDADLEILVPLHSRILSQQTVANQVARLSCHLGALCSQTRRAVIRYSLYVRKLHLVQELWIREMCGQGCPRPPVGCCGANHFVILSLSDILIARPSPAAMHLAHVISRLQEGEHAYARGTGRKVHQGYCTHLAGDGCMLRLFKSPRCIHYLCGAVEQKLNETYDAPMVFIDAMRDAGSQTISVVQDFMGPTIIDAAMDLFHEHLSAPSRGPGGQHRR
jgi:hypothetical protein